MVVCRHSLSAAMAYTGNIFTFCCLIAIHIFLVSCQDKMKGPGLWSVLNVELCPDAEKYPCRLDIIRNKINRTHDAFSGRFVLDEVIDESAGVLIDVCKWVDGGCKPYQKITDESYCGFAKKFAKDNFESILTGFGVDPPDCAMETGEYEIQDYVFNYDELPEECIYGRFGADLYILKDDVNLACVSFTVEFEEGDE